MNRTTLYMDLGLADYTDVWHKQEQLLKEIIGQKTAGKESSNYLLFVEHPHVYTLGKSGDEANMLINSIQLRAKHADFVKVDRGGDITYHGPGQLVVYPVIDLENFSIGVKEYVSLLEEVVIRTIAAYGISGERLEGATGVWIEPDTPKTRKICAIGVKCSRYVTMHGFALNINTDLNYFNNIHPCGFVDKGVTSLNKELGQEIDIQEIKETVKRNFEALFGMKWEERK